MPEPSATPVPSAVILPAVERIRRVEAEIGRYVIGRADEIHGLLLALVARQHVFLLSPPGSGKCLTGDTRVYDPETGQLVRLDSIVERVEAGDPVTVASLDNEMKIVSARVTGSARNGVRPVFLLRTRLGRQIRATAAHPFRAWDGWTELEQLKIGDYIAVPRILPAIGTRDFLSVDEAGLIGALTGDGCFVATTPILAVLRNEPLVAAVTAHANALGLTVNRQKSGRAVSIVDPKSTWHRPNVFMLKLTSLGLMGLRSQHKFVPQEMFSASREAQRMFLNRLFATDGSCSNTAAHKEVSYATISPDLARDVAHLLLRFGVVVRTYTKHPKVYKDTGKSVYELTITGRDNVIRFIDEIGAVGKDERLAALRASISEIVSNTNLDVFPPAAWQDVDRIVREQFGTRYAFEKAGGGAFIEHRTRGNVSHNSMVRMAKFTNDPGLAMITASDIWWDKIIAIEPAGTAETFDIEVEGFANFVADDIIVHNSLMASEVCRRIRGARFFRIDLHPFTMREELFGPISLSAMRERDALERRWEGYLPGATVAQLDEIWRCPPSTLNTLLTLLNEREFRQDELVLRSPLISVISTSNDLPPADRSLDALYDRILLRYLVAPLTATEDRRKATTFSLRMRTFETAARRAAVEIGRRRDSDYLEARSALADDQIEQIATVESDYLSNALALVRPDRWLIERHGERLSSPDERAAVLAGTAELPAEADRRELLTRMARWIDEEGGGGELPYRTFLSLDDLDSLASLVLAVKVPDAVDEALYRIIERAGAVSVRRETELRTLIAAEAVLAGRTTAAVRDLRVASHALWDRRDTRTEIRRMVEAETGNMDEELTALSATLDEWADLTAAELSVSESLALRDQMDLELSRFARLAEAYGDQAAVRNLLAEARKVRDSYERSIFAPAADAAAG